MSNERPSFAKKEVYLSDNDLKVLKDQQNAILYYGGEIQMNFLPDAGIAVSNLETRYTIDEALFTYVKRD